MKFRLGDKVFCESKGCEGVVINQRETDTGVYYTVVFPNGTATVPQADLLPLPTATMAMARKELDPPVDAALKVCAAWLSALHAKGEMHSLSCARVIFMPHQVFVAHRVCNSPTPRMLLADEVGLGKTIEAGIILKELKARGLAKRILVIAPASLVNQWVAELEIKFNERFVKYDSTRLAVLKDDYPGKNPWMLNHQIVTSLQLARLEKYQQDIVEADWDLVIFDEAHHLRRYLESGSTLSYQLAEQLC